MKNDIEKVSWIDSAKFFAIFAVLIDHSYGILYMNQKIQRASWYAVSLFIICAGFTYYLSSMRHIKETYLENVVRSIKRIFIAYLCATFIYQVIMFRFFDFNTYIRCILGFNITGPFYFVLLYIQLMLVGRILFGIIMHFKVENHELCKEILVLGMLMLFSVLTTNYSNVVGGVKFLGGTYLILFYLGMLFARYYQTLHTKIYPVKYHWLFFICLLWLGSLTFINKDQFHIDRILYFGEGINPPGISLIIFAIITCGLVIVMDYILKNSEICVFKYIYRTINAGGGVFVGDISIPQAFFR